MTPTPSVIRKAAKRIQYDILNKGGYLSIEEISTAISKELEVVREEVDSAFGWLLPFEADCICLECEAKRHITSHITKAQELLKYD